MRAAKKFMSKLYLFFGLIAVLICTACGTGNNSSTGGFGGGGTVGSFSNSSLKGNYAYQIVGVDISSGNVVPFRESGVFVADGAGNVTAGEDDFAEGSTVLSTTVKASTGGTAYSVSSDGTATVTLNFADNGGVQIALSVVSSPSIYLVANAILAPSGLLTVNGTGVAVPQTTSAFAAAPSGTFVFRMQSINALSLVGSASVGAFTVSAGSLTGNEDQNSTGTVSSLTLTGSFNPPDTMGRGTGTFTDSNNVTTPFFYYVIDGNHVHLFANSTTNGSVGVGRAVAQTGTTLSGSYVFGASDNFETVGASTVGQFTASSGSITGGAFDTVQNGAAASGTYAASAFTSTSNGRAVVNLSPSTGNAVQAISWVVSPSLVFFISNDANQQAGTATLQTGSSFSKSSINGTFGFSMDGFTINTGNTINLIDRAGNLHWDGAGNLGLTEFINANGAGQPSGILNGTYTVASNGRVVGSVANLSNNLVFYLASGSAGYMLQADTGTEIDGFMGQLQ